MAQSTSQDLLPSKTIVESKETPEFTATRRQIQNKLRSEKTDETLVEFNPAPSSVDAGSADPMRQSLNVGTTSDPMLLQSGDSDGQITPVATKVADPKNSIADIKLKTFLQEQQKRMGSQRQIQLQPAPAMTILMQQNLVKMESDASPLLKTPIETMQAETPNGRSTSKAALFEGHKDIDMLKSVIDQSEFESKRTSTNLSPNIDNNQLELTNKSYSSYHSKVIPLMQGSLRAKSFQTKHLLQKSKPSGTGTGGHDDQQNQNMRQWQMNATTGQVTVMKNAATIGSIGSNNVAGRGGAESNSANRDGGTVDSFHNNDRLYGRKYTSRRQTLDSNPKPPAEERIRMGGTTGVGMGTGRNYDLADGIASTLQKASYLNSLELIDSPNSLGKTQAIQQRPKTSKALRAIGIRESSEGLQNNQPSIFKKGGGGLSQKPQSVKQSIENEQQQQKGGRYHKRVQSAQIYNARAAVGTSMSRGGRNTANRALANSNQSSIGAGVEAFKTSSEMHQQQLAQRFTIDQSGNYQKMIEGRNFEADFDAPPMSKTQAYQKRRIGSGHARISRINQGSRRTASKLSNGYLRNCAANKSPPSMQQQVMCSSEFSEMSKQSLNMAITYNQHKLAEQMLEQEEHMAREQELKMLHKTAMLSNMMSQAMMRGEPETLLKRDCKTGATTGLAEGEITEKLFKDYKYDKNQNILLSKNPMIIRKDTFNNNTNFHIETAKGIIEVLSKKSTGDQMLNMRPHQVFPDCFQQEGEATNFELINTNVGAINIQKDQSNHALFNFLGKLQHYQTTTPQQPSHPPLPPTMVITKPNLKTSAVNQGVITQTKKRRLWSSSGIAPNIEQRQRLNSAVAKKYVDAKTSIRDSSCLGHRDLQESSDVVYRSSHFRQQAMYNHHLGSSQQQDGVRDGTVMQAPIPLVSFKPVLLLDSKIIKTIDDGTNLMASMELERPVKNNEEGKELALDKANVQVQQIQIALQKKGKLSSQNVIDCAGDGGPNKNQRTDDDQVQMTEDGPEGVAGVNDDYTTTQQEKQMVMQQRKRKRCQSAHPLNKNASSSRTNVTGKSLSSFSTTQMLALKIQGKNISTKELSQRLQHSQEGSKSRSRGSQGRQNNNKDKQSSEVIIVESSHLPQQLNIQDGIARNSSTGGPTLEHVRDPRSPTSLNDDATPAEYLTCKSQPMNFSGAMQNQLKKVANQVRTSQKFVSPTRQVRSNNSTSAKKRTLSTVEMSRRKLQELHENVNTDLYIFNPPSNTIDKGDTIGGSGSGTGGQNSNICRDSQKQMSQSGVGLSTILEPAGNGSTNLNLTIPLNQSRSNINRNSIKDYQSTLTVDTRSLIIGNTKEFVRGQQSPNPLLHQIGHHQSNSRNYNDSRTVQKQLSATSTQQMDNQTYRDNMAGADISARKMISPESKVYQKTNLPIHQRSNRHSHRSKDAGEGVATATTPGTRFTYTNFNTKLNFNGGPPDQKKQQRTRPQSYNNWRQRRKSRQQNQTTAAPNTNNNLASRKQSVVTENVPYTVCSSDDRQQLQQQHQQLQQMQVPSQTQFMISAIENLQGGRGPEEEKNFSSKKMSYNINFSPSEAQMVFNELSELPPEVNMPILHSCGNSGDIIVVTRPEDLEKERKPEPVKILHHKGLNSRKKGLSLVNYPKPQPRKNGPQRNPSCSRQPQKKPTRPSSRTQQQIRQGKPSQYAPTSSQITTDQNFVLSSVAMIMKRRSKPNNLHDGHHTHQHHVSKLSQRITLGITTPQQVSGNVEPKSRESVDLKTDSEFFENKSMPIVGSLGGGIQSPYELKQLLNVQQLSADGGYQKRMNMNEALSSEKQSVELSMTGVTRHLGTPGVGATCQSPMKESNSAEILSFEKKANTVGLAVTAIKHHSPSRRGVMSRQSQSSRGAANNQNNNRAINFVENVSPQQRTYQQHLSLGGGGSKQDSSNKKSLTIDAIDQRINSARQSAKNSDTMNALEAGEQHHNHYRSKVQKTKTSPLLNSASTFAVADKK